MNVEELKQACSDYFSMLYSEFEDYFYKVEENKYEDLIDFPDYFFMLKYKKYDGIAFKIIDKNTYLDTENVDLFDIDKVYKLVYIRNLIEFEAALSKYLKNYLYKN